jgi:hypothetical protein
MLVLLLNNESNSTFLDLVSELVRKVTLDYDKSKENELEDLILSVSMNCINAVCQFITSERKALQSKVKLQPTKVKADVT